MIRCICFGVRRMYTAAQIKALIDAGDVSIFYHDYDWRCLSAQVIKEHHGECQMCRAEKRLTRATVCHHVKHLKAHPELAYDRENLMPLCHDCHEKIHERGSYKKRQGFTNEEKW